MSHELWTALGMATFGIALFLIGRHLQGEYRCLFTDIDRASDDPRRVMLESMLRRFAVMFLSAGVMFVVIGIATAGNEVLRYWNRT